MWITKPDGIDGRPCSSASAIDRSVRSAPDLTCWTLTEGFAGMENQCVGLSEAVGAHCETKQVRRPRAPLRYLPPSLWPGSLTRVTEGVLAPLWPDLLISSGRGSIAAALAIQRASRGKIFTVHIQTPMWMRHASIL
jgi:mitochondrial fission protein ELM1